jgi:hypothetical protein
VRIAALAALLALLTACGQEMPVYQLGTQQWNDLYITVEARPAPGSTQTYEFLVIATLHNRKPEHSLMVSVRVNEQDAWKQAIQDGLVGVYRRAYKVSDPEKDVLYVQIKRGDAQGELQFPLSRRQSSTS